MTGRPADQQPATAEQKTRQRCKNCPKFFPIPEKKKGGSPREFCSPACRKEFHNNRSGFGNLKERLPKLIQAEVKRQLDLMTSEPIRRQFGLTEAEVEKIIREHAFVDRTEISEEGIKILKEVVRRRREKAAAEAAKLLHESFLNRPTAASNE